MTEEVKARLRQIWAEHGKAFGVLLAGEAEELKQAALDSVSKRDFEEAYKLEAQADMLGRLVAMIEVRLK